MRRLTLSFASTLTSLALFAACSAATDDESATSGSGSGGDSASSGTGASAGLGSSGGAGTSAGGGSSGGNQSGSGGAVSGGTGPGGGDVSGGGGASGGAGASGGGGDSAAAGASGDAGAAGDSGAGGDSGVAGSEGGEGGTINGGGSGGGSTTDGGAGGTEDEGPDVDEEGKANAKPGETTSAAQDYLRLGDIRILNNNWGSEDLGCNTSTMSVFVNEDRSFGWNFNRGDCDTAGSNQKPDFPQVEFGIHPFGIGNALVTSPEFSSTTLLPLQIKDIQSASVDVQNLTANFQQEGSWNITFEFWLSERDPVNDPNPGVYAELMTFWGWQDGRWPSPPAGEGPTGDGAGAQVSSASKSYTLWVQDDTWADGWRYFQFRADDGPQRNFNGSVDVKPFLDYLVNSRGYSQDLWVTRLEVGSEIDDNTQGTVQMSGISFEVNGETRAATLGE